MKAGTAALSALALASLIALPAPASAQAQTQAAPQAVAAESDAAKSARLEVQLAAELRQSGENSEASAKLMDELAVALRRQSLYDKAEATYRRLIANEISRLGEKHVFVAITRYYLADTLEDSDKLRAALLEIDLALPAILDQSKQRKTIVNALLLASRLYIANGRTARALGLAEAADKMVGKAFGEESNELLSNLAVIANAQSDLGRAKDALATQDRRIALLERLRKPTDASLQHARISRERTLLSVGRYDEAVKSLERLVKELKETPASGQRGDGPLLDAMNALANGYNLQGRFEAARDVSQEAYEAEKKRAGPTSRNAIQSGLVYSGALYRAGKLTEALSFSRMLLQQSVGTYGEADPLSISVKTELAMVHARSGNVGNAALLLDAAFKASNDLSGASAQTLGVLHELGSVLRDLEQYERSVEITQYVIDKRTETLGAEHRETLAVIHNQGLNYLGLKQHAKALSNLERCVRLIDAQQGAHPSVADLHFYLRTLGEAYQQAGNLPAARAAYARSIDVATKRYGEENLALANVYNYAALAETDPSKQIVLFTEAHRISKATGFLDGEWRSSDGLRVAYAKLKLTPLAVMHGKQAINALQRMRGDINQLAQSLQSGFLRSKREVYTGTADLLIEQGRLSEAQAVLALLKTDEYSEFTTRSDAGKATTDKLSLNRDEADWQARFDKVSDQLVALSKRKAVLDAKQRSAELSEADKAEKAGIEADLSVGRKAFEAATRQIVEESRRAALAQNADQRASRESVEAVRAMRSDLRAMGHDSVLLHYLVTQDKLWIMLTTPEVQIARESKISQGELNRSIAALRAALGNPGLDPKPAALALHKILIGPVARDLEQAKAKTLMLSLDGALRYVPFAALHDGTKYMAQDYRFSLFTEAAKSKIKDKPQAEWTFAGLGLTKAVAGFSPLPAVRQELSSIVRGASGEGVMAGETHLDEAFTTARVKSMLESRRPVLHIASHFKFTPGTEADSFLVMGDGGKLSLKQIREDDMQFEVDLLTLSACETAVGDNARGQEVEGLGALAQKQGAKAVLATLWPVADSSTGIFMREMYRLRDREKLTKAEAIRKVQAAFLSGQIKGVAGAERAASVQGAARTTPASSVKEGDFSHPYFWAPFILMGNWL